MLAHCRAYVQARYRRRTTVSLPCVRTGSLPALYVRAHYRRRLRCDEVGAELTRMVQVQVLRLRCMVHCMVQYMVHCMVHCIVHYMVHDMVHDIVHYIAHDMVHDTVQYMVHDTVQNMVHYIVHHILRRGKGVLEVLRLAQAWCIA